MLSSKSIIIKLNHDNSGRISSFGNVNWTQTKIQLPAVRFLSAEA